jgi:hypothetical protein
MKYVLILTAILSSNVYAYYGDTSTQSDFDRFEQEQKVQDLQNRLDRMEDKQRMEDSFKQLEAIDKGLFGQ